MTETTVKTSVLHGPRDLRTEERTLPPLGPGEALISIRSTGLCGSDLHYFTHFRNGDIQVREPLTLGHESAGVVVALGPPLPPPPTTTTTATPSSYGPAAPQDPEPPLAVGDLVALEVGEPCGACRLCAGGRYNICPGMRFRSSAKALPHSQGTLQELVVHPARWCHRLAAAVSEPMATTLGALAEPLAVAAHAWDRSGLSPEAASSASVLVLGAGAVGLLCAAVAKVRGCRAVVVADIQADRLAFAVSNGFADASVLVRGPNRRPETVDEKLAYAAGVAGLVRAAEVGGVAVGEVTATFECTGVEPCMQAAIYSTQPGGKILIIGMGNPVQTLPISAASLREVDLIGVFRYANTYPEVIRLLGSGDPRLPPLEKLVTHRFRGMENITKAFEMAARVKDDEGRLVLKVMVDM